MAKPKRIAMIATGAVFCLLFGGPSIADTQAMLYQSVPEVGALLLFGTGLVGLIGYRRIRRMQ